jgi:hypothetical protein
MKNLIIKFFLISSITFSAFGSSLSLKTEKGVIIVPDIQGWELGRDMFGMPFIYFSPQKNGQRSNISFTSTGVDVEFNLADFGKDGAGYKKIKKEWASKVNATPKDFFPYKQWKNNHGHTVHEVGFNYLHQGKKFIEISHYIDCRGRLIFSKSLRLEINVDHQKNFKNLITELDCSL